MSLIYSFRCKLEYFMLMAKKNHAFQCKRGPNRESRNELRIGKSIKLIGWLITYLVKWSWHLWKGICFQNSNEFDDSFHHLNWFKGLKPWANPNHFVYLISFLISFFLRWGWKRDQEASMVINQTRGQTFRILANPNVRINPRLPHV